MARDYKFTLHFWEDIRDVPRLSGREKAKARELFEKTNWDHVVWFPDWIWADDSKTIFKASKLSNPVTGTGNLTVGVCEDYSTKAIRFFQPQKKGEVDDPGCYAPKTEIVWLIRGEDLDNPGRQVGLFDF